MIRRFSLFAVFLLCIALTACEHLPTSELLKLIKYEREIHVAEAVKKASPVIEFGAPAFIRIFKAESVLELWLKETDGQQYHLYQTYPICSFSGHLGPKLAEGDHQAPEGFYMVGADQMNPWSKYHLSFDIGFPNTYDKAWGRTGTNLMVHGGCKSEGCYAITDDAVEEVYLLVEASIANGTDVPVHIFPFRMHARNMYFHRTNPWFPFWENLKAGHDLFETRRIPPDHDVDYTMYGPQYVFYTPKNWRKMAEF